MSDVDTVIKDVQGKIEREKTLMAGYTKMREQSNPMVRSQADNGIRECRRHIEYLEGTLSELYNRRMQSAQQGMRDMDLGYSSNGAARPPSHPGSPPQHGQAASRQAAPSPPYQGQRPYPQGDYGQRSSNDPGSGLNPPRAPYPPPGAPSPKGRPNYNRLDLIKYNTPFLGPRIQLMLSQLQFKHTIEQQYRDGFDKIVASYDESRDKKIRQQARDRRYESMQKLNLLSRALKRYEDLHVDIESAFDPNDDDSINSPAMRKPLSGHLSMRIHAVSDVGHAQPGRRSKGPETFVVLKVEDDVRARTKSTKNDRWTDELHEIEIDKGNEIELTVYDKVGSDPPVPIGMLWIRISDIAEEMRRKKIESEFNNSGWVSADRTMEDSQQPRPDLQFSPPPGQPGIQPTSSFGGPQGQSPPVSVDAWFSLEPVGGIHLTMTFAKTGHKRRGLERVGAVKKQRENAEVLYGHKFVPQQFYNIMRCALCEQLLKYAVGMQCTDCKYLCHKECYKYVVTKCISSSNAETDPDETKINHHVPHRFETFANVSANWCCHCGYILPLGKKTAKRCKECKLCAHAQCTHLVPDFCGLSMKDANQILDHINRIRVEPKAPKRPGLAERTLRSPSGDGKTRPSPPSNLPSYTSESGAKPRWSFPDEMEHPDSSKTSSQWAAQSAIQSPPQPQPGRPDFRRGGSKEAVEAAAFALQNKNAQAPDSQQQSYQGRPAAPQTMQHQTHAPYIPENYAAFMPGAAPPPTSQPKQSIPPPPPHDQSMQSQQVVQPSVNEFREVRNAPAPDRVKGSGKRIGLDHFNFLAVLGRGNFGKVMLAETKSTNQLFAIKVLKKEFIIENDEVESTKCERDVFIIANRARHPFLLNLHACFQTETRVYFVMEYISGGDLMLHIQRGQFGTKRAQFYAAEVCLALKYFHENGVVYRDLKLDNILLTLDGHIKIADYGLCKKDMYYGSTTSTFCGTPEFMAPEILLDKKYGRAVDWWAFGVLIYQMLLQQSPFRGEDEDEIYDAILADEPLYPIHMPRDSVSILQKLLTREPEARLGSGPTDAQEIMSHPFFRNINWEDVYHKRVPAPFQPQIKNATDTSNFDSEFTSVTPVLTPVQSVLSPAMQEEFRGFSYSADFA